MFIFCIVFDATRLYFLSISLHQLTRAPFELLLNYMGAVNKINLFHS